MTPETAQVVVSYVSEQLDLNNNARIFNSCADPTITGAFQAEGYEVIENNGEDPVIMNYPESDANITFPPDADKRYIISSHIMKPTNHTPWALLLPAECISSQGLHTLFQSCGVKVLHMVPAPLFIVNGKRKSMNYAWFLGGWPNQTAGKLEGDWVCQRPSVPRMPSSASQVMSTQMSQDWDGEEVDDIPSQEFTMFCDKCSHGIAEDDNLVCQGEVCNDVHMCADCAYVNADLSQILCGDCVGNDFNFTTYRSRVHNVAAGAASLQVSPRSEASSPRDV